jgi:hypothetical protein
MLNLNLPSSFVGEGASATPVFRGTSAALQSVAIHSFLDQERDCSKGMPQSLLPIASAAFNCDLNLSLIVTVLSSI